MPSPFDHSNPLMFNFSLESFEMKKALVTQLEPDFYSHVYVINEISNMLVQIKSEEVL